MQHRAVELLHQVGREYPLAWDLFADYQRRHDWYKRLSQAERAKQKKEYGWADWPDWCWCPLAGAHAILTSVEAVKKGQEIGADPEKVDPRFLSPRVGTGSLGALGAWRATQGIYQIDPDLYEELLNTPVTGDIPVEVLRRLPEWCVYVETPGFCLKGSGRIEDRIELAGFFAHLEYDVNTAREELRFSLDQVGVPDHRALIPIMLHLGGNLWEGLQAARKVAISNLPAPITPAQMYSASYMFDSIEDGLESLVSLVLYLCADEAEVPRPATKPPRFVMTKKKRLIMPTGSPVVHECGTRIGAQLRLVRKLRDHSRLIAKDRGIRYVEPHIRRAHWHTFLTGPRTEARVPRVKWLPPIAVKMDGVPELATVRTVVDERPLATTPVVEHKETIE